MYIFGGEPDQNACLKDLLYLDINTMTWMKPVVKGLRVGLESIASNSETKEVLSEATPTHVDIFPVVSTSSCVLKNFAFFFGGYDGTDWLDQLYLLNLDTHQWKIVNYKENVEARCRHTAILRSTDEGNQIFIFGGNNKDKSFNEIRVIDIPANIDEQLVGPITPVKVQVEQK